MQAESICVVGVGYVGLIQAVGLASFGLAVKCVDLDAGKIAKLRNGIPPIFEDGLEDALQSVIAAKTISFTTDVAEARDCDLFYVAVGTPTSERTGNARLDYLEAAVSAIADVAPVGAVIAVKSTVPIGTCAALQARLDRDHADKRLAIVSNPEFLREGTALKDFFNPERIVIGSASESARQRVRESYAAFDQRGIPMILSDTSTSETIKYAANAFLATKVTFINEISDLVETVGGDIDDVARGIGLDSRIGPQFLRAGPGYGGSCFPKDTLALATIGRRHGVQQQIVETVIRINDSRRFHILKRIELAMGDKLSGKRVAVLGLAFKANTDDVRDSPAVDIVHALLEEGAEVRAFDPVAKFTVDHRAYQQCESMADACEGASAVLIATEWAQFRSFDFSAVEPLVARRYMFDMRRIVDIDADWASRWDIERIGSSLKRASA
ncbi:UDP-glucose/GDP-mannose dehydrogenase family protein [Jiella sp. MQZ9-1]|uniref:UDP-glucose 6-dehydrogenase n=1 Tax=Jiella flava TaxID=2816857 RepID=A0A939FZX7_9HYPH|nr:UDP-glucose/GDP-mannose dehydrogenase family protein [Jiella flava]MCD2472384.1 UDP-glucose/GDP-mannose dehydrogenase family protein [Jiella flava]